ncbi:hypothetical protein FKW77_001015 [Venturia effusa]|uniref:ADP-ribose 1''-phosphate phosphatase n=1 Tax=Venturia effusa TaxID=50376 RepID=A0A517LAC3_9PEZI|nr:hypothetical protein FKW77_001015 [Venturia effusa]
MSTKRQLSPSGASRALKQTRLHFGRRIATRTNNQPQRSMATREDETSDNREGLKTGKIEADAGSDNNKSAADTMPKTTGMISYAAMASKSAAMVTKQTSSSSVDPKKFVITEITGDIFDAPDGTVIIHACNCLGSWAAGIAAAFKQRYPKAFAKYALHCKQNTPNSLWGTALLIPPMEIKGPRHYVGCIFTSRRYGRGKDSPAQILAKTGPSMEDLVEKMRRATVKETITEIRICQINSGLFSVPWEKSKAIIQELEAADGDLPKEFIVYTLPAT